MSDYILDLRKIVGHRPLLQVTASVIVQNSDGKILLHRRRDTHCWGYSGGSVELDEKVEDAAKRELFEKTGLTAGSLELFGIFSGKETHYTYPNSDEVSNIDIVYICKDYSGELKKQESEVEDLKFFAIKDLPEKISLPQKIALEQLKKEWNDNIKDIFGNWDETIIWSCLQGVMGEIHTNATEDAAMAILGDFAFYAGKPSEELIRFKPESFKQDFMIMVPQDGAWAELIELCYGDKAKKVTRYAFKKEQGNFDICKLEQAISALPEGYELKLLDEQEYILCQNINWANDLVAQFKDYDSYQKQGMGVVAFKAGELVAGASSYSRYNEGIEIEIDTKEEYRRQGLAYACGAKLILKCLEKGLYPSWDAQNMCSAALAKKLGYHFSHEYVAYEVTD